MDGTQPTGSSGSHILFEYSWAITREIDRINRHEMGHVSLASRIHKLRGLAEPFLWARGSDGQGPTLELDGEKTTWLAQWERISQGEGYDPRVKNEVRWRQFRHLMRLFHAEGVFLRTKIPWQSLQFQEMD